MFVFTSKVGYSSEQFPLEDYVVDKNWSVGKILERIDKPRRFSHFKQAGCGHIFKMVRGASFPPETQTSGFLYRAELGNFSNIACHMCF